MAHMFGHPSTLVPPAVGAELRAVVEDQRRGLVPLLVPMTVIRHYVRLLEVDYLADQTYLDPRPRELMLRNRV